MRFRVFSVVTGLALAIGVAVAVSTAGASRPISPSGVHTGPAAPVKTTPDGPDALVTLFDNNNNDSGVGISSQNFETDFDAYDDAAADDVFVPLHHKWKVKKLSVTGVYYNGSGPANSVNVRFYKKSGALPGALKKEFLNVVPTTDNFGSFEITLPSAAALSGGTYAGSGKTYWVSIQVNMDFNVGGQWGWEGSLNSVGNPDAWENPGDGFGTGCITWGVEYNCIGDLGQGPSKMFLLKGKDIPI